MPPRDEPGAGVGEGLREDPGVLDRPALVVAEVVARRELEGDGLGATTCISGPPWTPGKTRPVDRRREGRLDQSGSRPGRRCPGRSCRLKISPPRGAAQRLVGRGRDEVGVRERAGVEAGRDEAGDVGHVDEQQRADAVGDGGHALEVDDPRDRPRRRRRSASGGPPGPGPRARRSRSARSSWRTP